MGTLFNKIIFILLTITTSIAGQAQALRGSDADAVALVKKASLFLKQNGSDKAIAAFNDPKGDFVKGDLYVLMLSLDGVAMAHGQNPKMVGKNLIDMKIGDIYLIRELIKIAKSPDGNGWCEYRWPNSITQSLEDKHTYVERSGDMVIGVGSYRSASR